MSADDLRLRGRIRRGDLDLSVDLTVADGVTALVAPNGTGKTSVLRVIAGLDRLADGELSLDDVVLDQPATGHFTPAEERPVSLAFQEPRLFPHLTVLDNLAYPLRRQRRATDDARDRARVIAATLGLTDLAAAHPSELSGGQAQRVNLGRAIAAAADTLLLDEPLASIDDASRPRLRQVVRSAGSTRVLWVTHDPSDLDHVDNVITLADVVQTDDR